MQLLWEVIVDLYRFAFDTIRGAFSRKEDAHLFLSGAGEHYIRDVRTEPLAHEFTPEEGDGEEEATFRTVTDIISKKRTHPIELGPKGTYYVMSDETHVFQHPTKEFDGSLMILSYGEQVVVNGHTGKFAHATIHNIEGYIAREDLTDRASHVYPEFVVGEENDVDDPNTVRLRAIIQDAFLGGMLEYPLQAGEYVLYRLVRRGVSVPWTGVRPRVPGRWHVLLRGTLGTHSGITPKTGSVMEFTLEHDMGHLAYVEAVFPDETIMISEVNLPDSGVYNERTLTREEWREMKPVFISITS